mgnify:FL=1
MYYVGIDVAKDKHYVCILDEDTQLACKAFWIYSDCVGLNELVKRLYDLSLTCDDFILAVESTGAFSENIYEYLTDLDFKVILLNSYQTAKYRDFSTMKKVKNDSIDAYVIAELIATGKYKESHISSESYHTLKVLNRLKKSLNEKIKTIQREISTVMAIVNPEINNILPNIFTKTAIAIIKEYPTAKDLQETTPKKLCKVFRNIKGNNFNEDKAKALIDISKDSIYLGRARDARSLMITTNINILELIVQEKTLLEHEIKILIDENQDDNFSNGVENLRTIPGVADKTISAILGECGDLTRFDSAKAFIGYLGLYPTQYQSGNSHTIGRLAKRGIPIAKHALYMSAVASVLHNEQLRKIFRDKVSAGKSKKEALIIISKKIATMIYSMFKYNKPYNPNRVLVSYRK